MIDNPQVSELLLRWEELAESGQSVTAEELCRDCPELVDELRTRIRALVAMAPALETSVRPAVIPPPMQAITPLVPGYEILSELGRGGMGVVYKARHLALNRLVALKIIRGQTYASPAEVARFEQEAQAIAHLQHPNIVQIYEVGRHDGCPYFALEYVEGGSLDQKPTPMSPRQAAQLVETLARAMQHAHERGVIHRDLKPANVLLSFSHEPPASAAGALAGSSRQNETVPKITDFGLAKLVKADPGQTQSGWIVGTPSYMAPEQAEGKSKEVGPPADIYALGAILYELLTGRAPFRADSAWQTVSQVIDAEATPPRLLQPGVPRDLETICLKCLAKLPRMRYASAQDLADDLQRFLNGQPIQARPVSAVERLIKWSRRRPALAALYGVSILAVVILLGLWMRYSLDLRAALEDVTDERNRANREWENSRRSMYALQLAFVRAVHETDPARGLELLHDEERCPPDLRDFTWGLFDRLCKRTRFSFTGHKGDVRLVAFTPGGSHLVTCGSDGKIHSYLSRLENLRDSLDTGLKNVLRLAMDPAGENLALGTHSGEVEVWSLGMRRKERTLNAAKPVTSLAFSKDGATLAIACSEGPVKLWRFTEKETTHVPGLRDVTCLTFAGPLVVAADAEALRLWDTVANKEVRALRSHSGLITAVTASPDGRRLATADQEGTVRVVDIESGRERSFFDAQRTLLWSLAFSPDNQTLAAAGVDGVIRLWDLSSNRERVRLAGHKGAVWSLAFSPDSGELASAGADGTARVWNLSQTIEWLTLPGSRAMHAIGVSADGKTIVFAGQDKHIHTFDLSAGKQTRLPSGHAGPITSLALRKEADVLATGSIDGTVRLWRTGKDQPAKVIKAPGKRVLCVTLSGERLAFADDTGAVVLCDASGEIIKTIPGNGTPVWQVAFSPDGKSLAVAAGDRMVRLYDSASGQDKNSLPPRAAPVYALAFSPDGARLAVGGADKVIEIHDLLSPEKMLRLVGHQKTVNSLTYSPDGRTLVSAAADGTLRFWDPVSGHERLSLPCHPDKMTAVAFATQEQVLVSLSPSEIKVWKRVGGD